MRACSEEKRGSLAPLCVFSRRTSQKKSCWVSARGPSQVDWINRVMHLCGMQSRWTDMSLGAESVRFVSIRICTLCDARRQINVARKDVTSLSSQLILYKYANGAEQ
jgi:hypothetical protein